MGQQKPNIVVIVMDCVRAQNVSAYGYSKPTTPRMDALSREGLRYENAVVAGDQTLASTASLFTGRHTSAHQLRISGDVLPEDAPTLSDAFRRAGYRTHCLDCGNPHVSSYAGLDRGFDEYAVTVPALRSWVSNLNPRKPRTTLKNAPDGTRVQDLIASSTAVQVATATPRGTLIERLRWELTRYVDSGASAAFARARAALRAAKEQPAFVYVHLMETHTRYVPPLGHRGRFLPPHRGRAVWRVNQDQLPFLTGAAKMDELDLAILEGLYNGALHYTDRQVGRFLDWLRREGLLENTIVVVTADHGENFGEHKLIGHGFCVYDTMIHVPLFVWGPIVSADQRGRSIQHVVQNIDLSASMLRWAGVEADPFLEQVEGHPIPLRASDPGARQFAISESTYMFHPHQARVLEELNVAHLGSVCARSQTHKRIVNSTGAEEFYDLRRDPHEQVNLVNEPDPENHMTPIREFMAPHEKRFLEAHQAMLTRMKLIEEQGIDPTLEAQLRDLGYI